MKKSMFLLTAALSFGFAAAQTADPVAPATPTAAPAAAPQVPTLTDVPAGHWAKDAIDRLVSRGIILGYPDGTYRGTQNLTRYEAAVIIARLLDQIRTEGVPPGTTSEDLTALQNAIQELAADLTALGVRVSDLEENAVGRDDFARLEARVEELAAASGDAAAITAIQTQIAELTARADEYDTLRADIDDNASSIAALNDLTVLLNQDILNLQDRVSAVESAQADFVQRSDFDNLAGRVGTIDTRVTTLENAPKFSVGGTIGANYGRLALTSGTTNFDVDRLTGGTFAAGAFSNPNVGADVTDADTASNFTTGSLTFGVRASNLRTTNGLIVVNNAAINLGTTSNFFNVNGGVDTNGTAIGVTLSSVTADGTINGQKFDVNYQAYNSLFKFSDYLFNNSAATAQRRRGVVVNLEATQLPLQPKLTIVAGNANGVNVTGNPASVAGTGASAIGTPTANYYGVRAVVKPSTVSTVGVSFAQVDGNRSAFGVDYDVKFGVVGVKGEGVASIPSTAANFVTGGGTFENVYRNADGAFYTDVRADLGVVKFGANFRSINPEFDIFNASDARIANAGMSTVDSLPYEAGYTGFGAAIGTGFGPIALGAYGDTYVPFATTAPRTTAFGAKAGGKLGALELVGFYNRTTVNNAVVDSADDRGKAGMGIAEVPFDYTSTVGAQLKHDGAATNALVRNLNFTIANAYYYNSRTNNFSAYGDYSGTLAGITLQPMLRYNLVTNPDAGVADESNTLKYGIKLSTATLTSLPLQPSLYANFANRITNPGTALTVSPNGTTTELLGQVGISLNQFVVPTATAKVGYSYYQGFNVEQAGAAVGAANVAFDASDNRIYSGVGNQSGKAQGVFAQVGFSGLAANYGIFRYTNLTPGASQTPNVAQGFKVSYTFNF